MRKISGGVHSGPCECRTDTESEHLLKMHALGTSLTSSWSGLCCKPTFVKSSLRVKRRPLKCRDGRGEQGEGHEEIFWVMEIFYIYAGVSGTRVYTFVKTYQMVHLCVFHCIYILLL